MYNNGIDIELYFEKLKIDENYIKKIEKDINFITNKKAKTLLKDLISFTKDNKLIFAYSWAVFNLAKIYNEEAEYDVADILFSETYNIFKKNKDINGMLSSIAGFIAVKCMKEEYNLAIEWGIKGLKIAEENNNIERLIAIKGNMAKVYMEIEEYKKAIEILEEIDDIPWVGNIYNKLVLKMNRVTCEIGENNLEKALDILISIKTLVKEIPTFMIRWLIEIGKINIKKEEYKEAEDNILQAIELCEKNELYELKDEAILWLMDIYLIKKQYEKVIIKLKSIEDSVKKSKILRFIKDLYYKLNISYKAIEDYENAYFHFKKYVDIKEHIRKIQSDTIIDILDNEKEKMNIKDYKLLYNQNRILSEIGKTITANLNKEDIFNVLANQIKNFIKYDIIQISVYDEIIDNYRIQLVLEEDIIIDFKNMIVDEDSLIKYSINNKEDLLISDIEKEYVKYIKDYKKYMSFIEEKKGKWKNKKGARAIMVIPMIINDKVIGTISVQSYEKNIYDLKDLITLKILSNYLAIALDNSLLYKKVEYNANYDSLTGIYNRRKVIEKINELRDSLEEEDNYYISMIDIDNFKSINDLYGHNMGDNVLIKVAKTIKDSIKEEDILGRYGGEEFILIFHDNDGNYIDNINQIRMRIENLNIKNLNKSIKVTISIGVEKLSVYQKTLEENISLADKKLYEAKSSGKNKVVF